MKTSKIKTNTKISQKYASISMALMFTMISSSSLLLPSYAAAEELPAYVAFGDSLTTGSSVATCQYNRQLSPWGCAEKTTVAVPYPNKLAKLLNMTYSDNPKDYQTKLSFDLYRAGIWGYRVKEAAQDQLAGNNKQGNWLPQLDAIKQARQLVTGALGINDMNFSDISRWARLYIKPGVDYVTPAAQALINERSADFDKLFDSLSVARSNGAAVIIGLYYNPYDSDNPQCQDLKTLAGRVVDTLDDELIARSHQAGFNVADFRRPFIGHGAGSKEPYVFGNQCSLSGALSTWLPAWISGRDTKKAIAIAFDPHPNNAGTTIMANSILQELNNAD